MQRYLEGGGGYVYTKRYMPTIEIMVKALPIPRTSIYISNIMF